MSATSVPALDSSPEPGPPPKTPRDVPGWLNFTDRLIFRWTLGGDAPPGDLVELGVYQGRSAIHIAQFLRADEIFTLCDLFDLARDEETIAPRDRAGSSTSTHRLCTSTSAVTPSRRELLQPEGVVVFDGYRAERTVGTAAAVWEAMVSDGLPVICVSAQKFYGTWGDPTRLQNELTEKVSVRDDHRIDVQEVMGQPLLRIYRLNPPAPATTPAGLTTPAVVSKTPAITTRAEPLLPEPRATWRKVAIAVLPGGSPKPLAAERRPADASAGGPPSGSARWVCGPPTGSMTEEIVCPPLRPTSPRLGS